MAAKGPRLITQEMVDNALLMGINPATGNAVRINKSSLTELFKKQLEVLDEQQAINRYVWYNLPSGLTGQLIERILYYRGELAFFRIEDDPNTCGTFYCLPFSGTGGIDPYGRWNKITPLAFNGSSESKDEKVWIPGLEKKVVKEFPANPTIEDFENGAVILCDYSKQISEKITPRYQLQEPILRVMSEVFPLIRTNMYACSGVKGMRVQNQDDYSNVEAANNSIKNAAISGKYFVPIVGTIDFQELTSAGNNLSQEYLMALQAFDNYRLQLYGLKTGGIFEKTTYVNNIQAGNIQSNAGLQYDDGLTLRREFCDICNTIWGTSMTCEASGVINGEGSSNMDTNEIDNDNDQSYQEAEEE